MAKSIGICCVMRRNNYVILYTLRLKVTRSIDIGTIRGAKLSLESTKDRQIRFFFAVLVAVPAL
jgi:hypothetical protein